MLAERVSLSMVNDHVLSSERTELNFSSFRLICQRLTAISGGGVHIVLPICRHTDIFLPVIIKVKILSDVITSSYSETWS